MSQTEVQLIKDAVIVNADINSSAAIALSKIATGALPSGITVASANLVDGTIVNADINASAAIDVSKISGAMPTAGGTFTSSVTFTGDVHFDGETAGRDIDFDRSENRLEFADNASATFGSSNDSSIVHDGSNFTLTNVTGEIRIRPKVSQEGIIAKTDGAVELYFNGGKQFETLTNGIKPTNNLFMNDNKPIYIGTGLDLQIFHDGTDDVIHSTGTSLRTRSNIFRANNAANTAVMFRATAGGNFEAYHDGSKKFETVTGGATITGVCTATSFSGSGANLTDVDAGATGGGNDKIFYENGQTVTTNYTIGDTFGAACNAMAAGPITIDNNVVVTVNSGETLTIV